MLDALVIGAGPAGLMAAEALATANDSEFGLTAGIMTRSLARASHFRANMRAGCVMVNLPTAGVDYHVPFGGRKMTGAGRELGGEGLDQFRRSKMVMIAPEALPDPEWFDEMTNEMVQFAKGKQ